MTTINGQGKLSTAIRELQNAVGVKESVVAGDGNTTAKTSRGVHISARKENWFTSNIKKSSSIPRWG